MVDRNVSVKVVNDALRHLLQHLEDFRLLDLVDVVQGVRKVEFVAVRFGEVLQEPDVDLVGLLLLF